MEGMERRERGRGGRGDGTGTLHFIVVFCLLPRALGEDTSCSSSVVLKCCSILVGLARSTSADQASFEDGHGTQTEEGAPDPCLVEG